MNLASSCSAFVCVVIALIFIGVSQIPILPSDRFIGFALADALTITFYCVGMNIGPKYISSSEASLISLIEMILGPLWVFLMFNEVPSFYTIAGGILLISTLIVHELAGAHDRHKAARTKLEPPEKPVPVREETMDLSAELRECSSVSSSGSFCSSEGTDCCPADEAARSGAPEVNVAEALV